MDFCVCPQGGLSPLRLDSAGAGAFARGFALGVQAFRPELPHAIPTQVMPGFTEEGRDIYLGMSAGLMHAEALFKSSNHETGSDQCDTNL